jgi:hypothetical protein
MLDTNALSELVRNPHGPLARKLTAQDPDAAVRLTALELNALRTELMGIKALLSSAAPSLR